VVSIVTDTLKIIFILDFQVKEISVYFKDSLFSLFFLLFCH